MKKRPWILVILALVHILAPIGNIALNAFISNNSLSTHFQIAMEASYLQRNWPMFLAPILAGIAIYACKRWSFMVFLLSMVSLLIFSFKGYLSKAHMIGIGPVIFIYAVNALVVGYFLLPAVREIYMNPRLRWWETKPRYRCDFIAKFTLNKETYDGVVGNFSEGGLFLKSTYLPEDHSTIEVNFEDHDSNTYRFKGKVVFHGSQKAAGFGLMFIHGRQTLAEARVITQSLEKSGFRMGDREKLSGDTFANWLKVLLTTGSGLIPKKDKSFRS